MSRKIRTLTIYGTRPEAIKFAPIIRALQACASIDSVVAVTGQHRQMLDQVHRLFNIKPDYDLELMRENQTLNGIAGRVMLGLDPVLEEARPDIVLVHGDTTSAMAAAVAAFNRQIPIVHVEAGLRSGDLGCPFPEEANRKIIAQIARLHLAPTEKNHAQLLHEGIPADRVKLTGNSSVDALKGVVRLAGKLGGTLISNPRLGRLMSGASSQPIILVTMHRRENMGARLSSVARAVSTIAQAHPECTIVWPGHKKPGIYPVIKPVLEPLSNVVIVEPLMYHEFIHLVCIARVILTDSGGVQEEGVTVGTPVLVTRDVTDRSEAIGAGRLIVVGTDEARIVDELESYLAESYSLKLPQETSNSIFGDGHAADRTVEAILGEFGDQVTGFSSDCRPMSCQDENCAEVQVNRA